MRPGLTTAVLLLLAGCAGAPRRPPPDDGVLLRLAPAALGREVTWSQRLVVRRGEDVRSLDAQVEVDAGHLRIAAMAAGQAVATLAWDGATLEVRTSPHVPATLDAARIVSDVQLAFWPAAAVAAGLPPGYRLEESPPTRTVTRDGRPVVVVTHRDAGHLELLHLRDGYRLEVESVEVTE